MTNSNYTKPLTLLLLASFSCLLWGSAFPTLKISYEALGIGTSGYAVKLQFAGYRFFLAGLYLLLFMVITKRSLRVGRQSFFSLVILGLIQTSLQYLFFYNGLANTSGVKGAILTSLGTFFSIILPHFYYANDRLNLKKLLGLIIGFSGIIYMNISKGPLSSGFSFTGEGFMILAALTGAVSSIMAKELSRKMDTVALTCYQMLIGSSSMILFSWIKLGGNAIPFKLEVFPLFLHLALISSVGFGIWFTLLSHNPVSRVSIYKFQIPVWGSILSALFIPGESLSLHTSIALVLVSIGIFVVNMPKQKTLTPEQ